MPETFQCPSNAMHRIIFPKPQVHEGLVLNRSQPSTHRSTPRNPSASSHDAGKSLERLPSAYSQGRKRLRDPHHAALPHFTLEGVGHRRDIQQAG